MKCSDQTAATPKQPPAPRKKPGRRPGSENRQYDVVNAESTACKKCGSTERTAYTGEPERLVQRHSDATVTITWKKCQCLACGQWRKDRYESRAANGGSGA